jgi:hypothetical protein
MLLGGSETLMADLDIELAAYRSQLRELENKFFGKWVVFHGTEHVGVFDAFETAAQEAVKRFGAGPYLIREVGAPPVSLPVSFARGRSHGRSALRF